MSFLIPLCSIMRHIPLFANVARRAEGLGGMSVELSMIVLEF